MMVAPLASAGAPPSSRVDYMLGEICWGMVARWEHGQEWCTHTFRTAVTTDMPLPDTLACAATVTVCNVQPHGRRKNEQSQNTPAPAAPLLSTYVRTYVYEKGRQEARSTKHETRRGGISQTSLQSAAGPSASAIRTARTCPARIPESSIETTSRPFGVVPCPLRSTATRTLSPTPRSPNG